MGKWSKIVWGHQALYSQRNVPAVVKKINNALRRADQIQVLDRRQNGPYWFALIVADAEAGFGGPLNAFELMKGMIEAGASGVRFENQLASAKKMWSYGWKSYCPCMGIYHKVNCGKACGNGI